MLPNHVRKRDANGFTLIEVVVALALFMVLASSVLVLIGASLRLGRDSKYRTEAISLASREIEITRDTFNSPTRGPATIDTNLVTDPSPLPGGTKGQPLVVNNVAYTVKRTAQWTEMGNTAISTCDDGSNVELAYLRVKVQVSWPGLGSRPPVTLDTVITPPKGTYSDLTGHAGIKVVDRNGAPEENIPVTATGPSGTFATNTSSDGCALFAFLQPGTYAISVNKANYVDRNGNSTASLNAQVQAGQLWRSTVSYDLASSLNVTYQTDTGYGLPVVNTLPTTLGNSSLVPAGTKSITGTGNSRQINSLWAYPAGYQVWSGTCLDNDPQYQNIGTRPAPITVTPGQTSNATATLEPVQVNGPSFKTITANQASDSACASGQTVTTLGVTGPGGVLFTSLPTGTWTITGGGKSGKVVVQQAAGADTVNLS